MKVFEQIAIILGCLAVGELVIWATGLAVPSSIIGLLTLTALLEMRVVNIERVERVADFLVANMGLFFVPPGVALMLYLDVIEAELWPIVIAVVVSTVLVMVATGWSHQLTTWVMRSMKGKKNRDTKSV